MAFNATRNTIQGTLNWAAAFILNRPSRNVGTFFQEPGLTLANLIMSTILAPPFAWQWNRTITPFTCKPGVSDYVIPLPTFGWLEKVTITLPGMVPPVIELEIKPMLAASGENDRPSYIAVVNDDNAGNITFRLMSIPDQPYVVTLTTQNAPIFATSLYGTSIGTVQSVAAAVGGLTTYQFTGPIAGFASLVGTFFYVSGTNPAASPVNGNVSPNDGLYLVTASSATSLTLQNPNGILQTGAAGIAQPATTWAPIPDKYNFLYERSMLAHLHSMYDMATYIQELQIFFKQLVGCSVGLSDTAKAIFLADQIDDIRTLAAADAASTGSPRRGQQ
jgi:hypothetical protein